MEKILVSIVGPTAIGKTKLAIAAARFFDTEIVSADSRQFYREMTIGTAVPSLTELNAAPHHFIQHKSISEAYSVGDYEQDALSLLQQLFEQQAIVILVGGSGLYTDAVTKGLDQFPEIDPQIRIDLNLQFAEKGLSALQLKLKALDPEHYTKIDQDNPHRVIRALEVCLATGKPYSSFLGKDKAPRFFKTITLGISTDREFLYERIEKRVDQMMEQGLLEEARSLYPKRDLNALQTVGYRELFRYIDGEYDLDFAVSEIKKNTRRFAKRQMTWYRKNKEILWVDHDMPLVDSIALLNKQIIHTSNG
tara:strand:+ start:1555 stop:2475 length:921 start_codon:yes stop_codon:yes gene_type:complete